MADVEFGFVHDFGAGEEFVARRGEGATLGGEPIRVAADGREAGGASASSRPSPSGRCRPCEALAGKVYRLRVVGSIAITASYVAAGRFDAMLSLRPCRSVDAAAAQLIVREAGGAVAFGDLALERGAARPRRPLPDRRRLRRARRWRPCAPRRPPRQPCNRPRQKRFKNMCSLRTYVRYTRERPGRQTRNTEGIHIFMATRKTAANPKPRPNAPPRKPRNRQRHRQSQQTRRDQDRRRREEPGPDRRRGRRRPPGRHRPQRQRPRLRPGRAVHRPQQRRETAQVLPHAAAQNASSAPSVAAPPPAARRPPRPARPATGSSARPASASARSRRP